MTAALLKDLLDEPLLNRLANAVAAQHSLFSPTCFLQQVLIPSYADLALKQRISHVATVLWQQMDLPLKDCCARLKPVSEQITGLPGLVFPELVAKFGLDDFAVAMDALAHFTCGSTAEFAIRPFIERYPQQTLQQLQQWTLSNNHHHRRLASEGCRPRLPWGNALPVFKQDPTPLLPILTALKADHSEYVRRSVANNLNDISKDHPDLVLALAQQWRGQTANTDRILRHALRGLLKSRDARALALFDCQPRQLQASLALHNRQIRYGELLQFSAQLQLSDGPAPLRVEYAIDFAGKNGQHRHKVFQWLNKTAGPGVFNCQKSYRFTDLTTRKHYAGAHRIHLVVNGNIVASADFELIRHNS